MIDYSLRLIQIMIPVNSCPIPDIHIFQIGKMPFVKTSYFLKHTPPVNGGATAGSKNFPWLCVSFGNLSSFSIIVGPAQRTIIIARIIHSVRRFHHTHLRPGRKCFLIPVKSFLHCSDKAFLNS